MNIVFFVYRDHENSIRYLGEGSTIEEWGETCKGEIRGGGGGRGDRETKKEADHQLVPVVLLPLSQPVDLRSQLRQLLLT